MSTADRPTESPAASDVAGALADASFVRLVSAGDGDALAATGLLGRAARTLDVPFQASVLTPLGSATRNTDADVTVAVGTDAPAADLSLTGPSATALAFATARDLGADPDVGLALAGTTVAGDAPGVYEAAEAAGIERRPGLALATDDTADALAHSTLVHAAFSGDPEATAAAVGDIEDGEDAGRRLASMVALAAVESEAAPPRAADAVERALYPYRLSGPFPTAGGYGDVLDCLARAAPGTGVALALGHNVRAAGLDAWRDHAREAHAAVAEAVTGRYDGLFVARTPEAPLGTAARLVHGYRSPEPATLVVAGETAALVTAEADAARTLRTAVGDGGTATGTARLAHARFAGEDTAFIGAVREVVA